MKKQLLVWLGSLVAGLALIGVAYAVYTIVSVDGTVTVEEAITVAPETFTVTLYPAETVTETLTLSNAGSVGIEVNFIATVDPVDPEMTVSVPAKVTVPAEGSTTADIDVIASKSAVPGTYTISVGVTR